MKRWLPFELHTHTFHSDGKHSLRELAISARNLGLHGIALTDHNTMTGLDERDRISAETGVAIIRGLEWTTFFGHMVTLGIEKYVDWRNLSPFHLHRGIRAVHEQGGIVGVAHPFRTGSPMCTGCYWEFEVSDWHEVDYFEVWSETFPSIVRSNARAFAKWTDLLNAGYRISATCGRDWHTSDPISEPVAATFLYVRDGPDLEREAIEAIRGGKVAVSMGPLPVIELVCPSTGRLFGAGDVADVTPRTECEVRIRVDASARAGFWNMPQQMLDVRLAGNTGVLQTLRVPSSGGEAVTRVVLDGISWLRAELFGTIAGVRTMIGFTNPVYVR